jgi:hypothetical protein
MADIISQFKNKDNIQLLWDLILLDVKPEKNTIEHLTRFFNDYLKSFISISKIKFDENQLNLTILEMNKYFLKNIISSLRLLKEQPIIDKPLLQDNINLLVNEKINERKELYENLLPKNSIDSLINDREGLYDKPPEQKQQVKMNFSNSSSQNNNNENEFIKIQIKDDIGIQLPIIDVNKDNIYNDESKEIKKGITWGENKEYEELPKIELEDELREIKLNISELKNNINKILDFLVSNNNNNNKIKYH